jgi:hypothetical protein
LNPRRTPRPETAFETVADLRNNRIGKRRGWDSNPRATFRPPAVFKTAPFDRSGTPPREEGSPDGYARTGRKLSIRSRIAARAWSKTWSSWKIWWLAFAFPTNAFSSYAICRASASGSSSPSA